MYAYSGAWSLSLCSLFLTTYFTCQPSTATLVLASFIVLSITAVQNHRGFTCKQCSVLRVLIDCRVWAFLLEWYFMGFHFPTSCCLISQILFSKITRGKKNTTCKVMRLSVNHKSQHQQPCMMQETIGMGSLQSRERLPFKRRTFKEWDFEQSYFSLQPSLPFFPPAMSKIYKQWKLELCKIYHFR